MSVSIKTIIRFVFAVFFFSIVLILPAFVQAKNQIPTKTVMVMGTGKIYQNNSARAREEAIAGSLVSAVDRVAMEIFPLESMVRYFQAFNEMIYNNTNKFIQDYKVLAEFPSTNNYRVMVEATVSIITLKKLMSSAGILLEEKPLPKILILISDQNQNDRSPNYWWGQEKYLSESFSITALVNTIKTKGFPIIDNHIISQNTRVNPIYDKPDLNDIEAINLSLSSQAGVVIVGKSVASISPNIIGENIRSFKAIVSARAIRTDTGAEIATTMQTSVTANTDEIAGVRDALSRAGSIAGEDLASQIVAGWQKQEEPSKILEIIVEGTGDIANFEKFRRILNNISGVKNLRIKELKPEEAVIIVDLQGTAKELADALMLKAFGLIGINIYEVSQDRLRIELIAG
ncbi:MAG: hypothetical protein SRB2_01477 [Desulfobacteraceae bacterium Eth-SRB2]|nr:MAG: hypothetical protein SRB2_01477 [Desulfobacteraceae bacterium Eth-SRB2]